MKKLSVVFAMLLMLVLCISVGASELDVLKEPLNATYTTSLKTELSNADEFIAALEELSGEELDIDGQGMVDAYMFLGSLFDILGESTMKVDISEDYNKIKLSTESAVDLNADVNKNLYVFAHATTSVWIDMDISDITNPKCLVIISEPNNKKYQYIDLFETMDDETKLQTILVLKAILNEQVIGGINDSIIAMYEDNAEITSDKDKVTVRFDNEGFVKLVDDVIDVVAEYAAMFDPENAEEYEEMKAFSLSDYDLQFLGEKGVVFEYKKDGSESKAVCDFNIDFNSILAALGEETLEMENDLVLSFTITETQWMDDVGTTVVTFPELTEENSINLYDEYFNDDYYDEDEYEFEYPYYFGSATTDYLPIVDGEIYVPLRAILEDAYDAENVNIAFDNGFITVTSEYFTDMEKISFKVGDTKANVDGYDFEVGTILLENGVTYVPADFFEIIFGWELESAYYDYLDNDYYVSFYTDPYVFEW